MTNALEILPEEKLQVTHQTGESDFEKIKEDYRRSGWETADVRPYISDMVAEFAKSDLIICRAGATSCAELAAAGRASLMIPLPTAADDHQRKNAEALEKAGAARMILQKDLTGESLASEIANLVNQPEKILAMAMAAKKLARADAAEVTINIIEDLAKRK
jgi:UDP-N-acetylglucosamine--N-acetylmuramyl-(pentapeptide) pyrophosphoryl-undecaprenol N-acetylglucosamine transferase